MKRQHFFLCVILATALSLFHCGSDDEQPPEPADPELISIELSTDSEYTVTNSPRAVKLTAEGLWDDGTRRALTDYSIEVNGTDQGKLLNFSSTGEGTYLLKALSGEVESPVKTITVRPALELEMKKFIVIFHVVHDGEPVGTGYNIEASRIGYQMELLEKTFERNNRFTPNSTMPLMDFELATTGLNVEMLTEAGINRVQRPSQAASVLFEDWMWDHYWDPDYYINVWVGDTKNGYSWGIYPSMQCAADEIPEGLACADLDYPQQLEGIALELDNLYTENWVFPHEMGHVFGLFHIFAGSECNTDVDHCADTQQYNRTHYENGADHVTRESCTGKTFTSYNIMDYWRQPDGQRDLSYDQVLRIRSVIDYGNFRGTKSLSEGTPREMVRPAGG